VSVPRGLGAPAIADHNTIVGAQAAREIAHFLVVIGGEISTSDGETVGLFQEWLREGPTLGTRSPFLVHFRGISAEAFGNLHRG